MRETADDNVTTIQQKMMIILVTTIREQLLIKQVPTIR